MYPIERSLSDFSEITIGTSYVEVVDQLGEPDGTRGFGILWPYYRLHDDSYVSLYFGRNEKGEYTSIFDITITDPSGRVFGLRQSTE